MLEPITPPWDEICERCDCFKEEGTGRKEGKNREEEGMEEEREEGRGQTEVEETSQKKAVANHFQLTLYSTPPLLNLSKQY